MYLIGGAGAQKLLYRQYLIVALFAAASAAWASQAQSAEWWFVSSSNDTAVFIDRSSLTNEHVLGREIRKAWAAGYYIKPDDHGTSSKMLMYIDCKKHEFAVSYVYNYAEDGSVTGSQGIPDAAISWVAVAPESMGDAQVNFVCHAELSENVDNFTFAGNNFVRVPNIKEAVAILSAGRTIAHSVETKPSSSRSH